MTWVFGWPLYDDDAIEIAKKRNLVKDPNVDEQALIDAAQRWVARKAGFPHVLACWEDGELVFIFAAYVDWRDRAYPPQVVFTEDIMPPRQRRLLRDAMPLRDLDWYRHCDGSWSPYKGELWSTTDLDPEDELSAALDDDTDAEDSDEDLDYDFSEGGKGGSDGEDEDDEGNDEDASMSMHEDEDTDSDDVTVTDGVPSKFDFPLEEATTAIAASSLPNDFDARCNIVEL